MLKYEKGAVYHVLRPLGLKVGPTGRLQLAERPERHDRVVQPDDSLRFVGRRDGKLIFSLDSTDGPIEVMGHNNHFDGTASYNTMTRHVDSGPSDRGTRLSVLRDRLAKAEAVRDAAEAELKRFLTENPDLAANGFSRPSTDAREEARRLFAAFESP